ncbi:hypothetical protein [Nocardia camponoti]|uniref:Uncharacterized protein n=1 Tax=Nocardia camponoti TaxID=1616106 RepID=A0A917QGW9_9NOCA|nr:hypothetical protein [Nocardia camponoti]GGK48459.1 hypothetical protein GCM10011591_19810 [Nocardia camponoti]
MSAYLNEQDCRRFVDDVKQAGGNVPASLTSILATLDAVTAWDRETVDIGSQIRNGTMTAANASKLLDEARAQPVVNVAELKARAASDLARQFKKTLNDSAADQIIESLRPAFNDAVAGIQAAAQWITPDTQAEQVLDLGDEAIAAWIALPKHRQVLDRINDAIVGQLGGSGSVGCLGVLPWMHYGSPTGVTQALFYVRDESVDILNAGRYMSAPVGGQRGGRWLRLATTTTLQLNTLTRAKELCAAYTAADAERQAREYAATHPETL